MPRVILAFVDMFVECVVLYERGGEWKIKVVKMQQRSARFLFVRGVGIQANLQ